MKQPQIFSRHFPSHEEKFFDQIFATDLLSFEVGLAVSVGDDDSVVARTVLDVVGAAVSEVHAVCTIVRQVVFHTE